MLNEHAIIFSTYINDFDSILLLLGSAFILLFIPPTVALLCFETQNNEARMERKLIELIYQSDGYP